MCAFDLHGNQGPCSALVPTPGTTDAPPALPTELSFTLAPANPGRRGAALRLALPRAAHVAATIFDAQGRRIATLAQDWRDAGVYLVRWDGMSDAGAAAGPGLYLARAQVEGRTFTLRLILTR